MTEPRERPHQHAESELPVDLLLQYQPAVPGKPPWMLVSIATGLLALAGIQPVLDPDPIVYQALEVGIPGSLALGVVYSAHWITTLDRATQKHASAVVFSLIFMAMATSVVLLIFIAQRAENAPVIVYEFGVVTALAAGAIVGTPTGIIYDEVLARQDALEDEITRAQTANQQLQVVNRVMRHNVRNELTVALGALDIIDPQVEGDPGRRWLDSGRDALHRLQNHAEKTLKIESLQQSRNQTRTVDLVSVVEGYVTAQQNVPRGVELATDFPETALVRAHPLIDTAVIEAIDNAIEHNREVDPEITVQITKDEDRVEYVVADTGHGVPRFELETLASLAEQPLHHCDGVGLWLMKWVVDASGGSLEFEDNQPQGTVVRIRLPAADSSTRKSMSAQ